MKQKIILGGILVLLTALLWTINKGVFANSNETYVQVKIPAVIDYNFDIKPILSDKCYACHGPDANERKAGLRLDLEDKAFLELPENPGKYALVKGNSSKSELYQRIITDNTDAVMPPADSQLHLTTHEKKLIKKWIEQGAKYEKHWAFLSPVKSQLPKVKQEVWIQNEIDAFILEKIEDKELRPSQKASKETLARRISLDLTGLPPNTAIVEGFLNDNSNTAIANLIDQLMALPTYGERMAQEWLDVSRYADSHGYQDDSYRSMWPWRDWVIHAFNTNLPYDEFLTKQLAGDLLPNANKEDVLATGFNRNHPITQEGGVIQEEYRSYYVVDRTNTLGKGILGLTLECAKCHDHKYDQLSQKEYFEMYAFFNNVKEQGLRMDAVQAANQKYFADAPFMTISDVDTTGVLSFINKKGVEAVNVMVMNDSVPREAFIFNRGEYDDHGEQVYPNTPKTILPFADDLPRNRLGLAQWVTSEKNPLTARVFVNRVWGMLFGNGLVVTAEDFGVQGSLPTHPELLDWLSKDFMEHNWDIKYLIKKIVLSATYQQSSVATTELKAADPENILLARAPRFRMSGEMIRDYVLATSNLLNREIGGPSVRPYQPKGLWEETNAGGNRGVLTKYVEDSGDSLYRRSIYTIWKRTLPPPGMTIFDAPNRDYCEVRRQKTNTPLQALALQNDVQMLEAARVLAQNTLVDAKNDVEVVNAVFKNILIRSPKEDELKVLEDYYNNAKTRLASEEENAEKLVAIGHFNRLKTDPVKTAALMLTAQVIYNLDETITKE
ncbi:PSD1 and planctomycete cytochrome C domain-containing protein [Cellulophaga sp. F20128]|uniref:PSD1 and planctomycete cytochrome C domain-containing protein n=1 Tax=Cellulophaga sp. F20128 TaxID=2926413 RepID=UPI001FF4AC59|nr:PSD1 and planctomycete cytochrome C domain-containing protein [Cellulophaga sp. F20128]MCK0157504.1 PSD1 and planctomycete cytochrome C domain-containing protein [Cellulophaga sp. F20128]